MKISVIVLNFNGIKDTSECISSLKAADKGKNQVNIIVIDNNSKDGSQKTLEKIKGINLIKINRNLGYSGGMNAGIKEAQKKNYDAVILLNNDTRVEKKFLINLLESYDEADIFSPKIYFEKGSEFHKNLYKKQDLGKVIWYAGGLIDWKNIIGTHLGVDKVDNKNYQSLKEVDYATGACMLIKRSVFEKIGLLDEKYFLYLEDMDFCLRAKKASYKIIFVPTAIVWHKNARSAGGSGSKLQDYYVSRNRLYFAHKFASFRIQLSLIKQLIKQRKIKALCDAFALIVFR